METKEKKEEAQKWYQSFATKMIVLGVLSLVLLIPLEMVKSVIQERIRFSEDAKHEISSMWSGKQVVTGPVLNLPIRWWTETNGEQVWHSSVIHIMPDELNINGHVSPEIRYRGIYKSVVYASDLKFDGAFVLPENLNEDAYEIDWQKAYLTLGISDNRGIKNSLTMDFGGEKLNAVPGVKDTDLFSTGTSFLCPLNEATSRFPFSCLLLLNGSENLTFSPVGKKTSVQVNSAWKDPAFTGKFLPVERVVNDDGFKANWVVTELNRTFPQYWKGKQYKIAGQEIGINFLLMADHYQKALRSTKYGILFILLTFVILVFVELLMDNKIELLHYVLIAFALILFFSLLTALSEHIGFNPAYTISMATIVGLIGFFSWGFIQKKWGVFVVNGLLILFYVFIFILLSLKDYAYLAGNIGLIIILSIIMGVSRKLRFNSKIKA